MPFQRLPKKERIKRLNVRLSKRFERDKLISNVNKYISDTLAALQSKIQERILSIRFQDITPSNWYAQEIRQLTDLKMEFNQIISNQQKDLIKAIKQGSKELHLDAKVVNKLIDSTNESFSIVMNKSIQKYQETTSQIYNQTILKSDVAEALQIEVAKTMSNPVNTQSVLYSNGRLYKVENYLEMKIRTEIQNEVSNNMVETAQENGVVFFTCSNYGDCADDHADMQELGLFFDEKWESTIQDKSLKEQIQNYIDEHKLISVQAAMGREGNYFTTRPNCRHFFQMVDVESVLEIKDAKDLNSYRKSQGIMLHGKYEPKKYKALQQQRAYERNIRANKTELNMAQNMLLNVKPNSNEALVLKEKISQIRTSIEANQKANRELIAANDYLVRQYQREKPDVIRQDFKLGKVIK